MNGGPDQSQNLKLVSFKKNKDVMEKMPRDNNNDNDG